MINLPISISGTQKALLDKEFSCQELVSSYLERIEKYDKDINSFITITEDKAFEDAAMVDKTVANLGEKAFTEFPLLGVAIAHKDLFLTKGIRTTAASKLLESYIPAYSGTVVKRLEDAGAVLMGKLNCDAWAHGSSGENSDFGPTKNPWDKDFVAGGSSSGSAGAVASGFSLVATGTDTCGSIRLPANFCGISALKPTYGVVSRYGVVAMASSLDSVGPMAHSVKDLERSFKVMNGVDSKDSTLTKKAFSQKQKKVIGIPKEFFIDGVDRDVEKSVLESAKFYEKQGYKLKEISLPHTQYGIATYYIIQPAEVSSNLARYDGIRFGEGREKFGDEAKRRIMLGTYVLSSGYYDAYYKQAMKVRRVITEEVNAAFEKVDAIIAPVSATPAFKLGEKVNDPLKMYLTDIFAATANLSGIPSLAIPSGFTNNGLPLGFQLMGPRFGEEFLFKLGNLYQENFDWHTKIPKL